MLEAAGILRRPAERQLRDGPEFFQTAMCGLIYQLLYEYASRREAEHADLPRRLACPLISDVKR
jgi:hypothetical protein